jgi:hypothetical protein
MPLVQADVWHLAVAACKLHLQQLHGCFCSFGQLEQWCTAAVPCNTLCSVALCKQRAAELTGVPAAASVTVQSNSTET